MIEKPDKEVATYTVYCDSSSESICVNIEIPYYKEGDSCSSAVGAEVWLRSRRAADDFLMVVERATNVGGGKYSFTAIKVGNCATLEVNMHADMWQHLYYLVRDAIATVYDGCSLPILERK